MRLHPVLGAYKRDAGYLPELRLRNLIPEKTPAEDDGVILLSRPGFTTETTVGGSSPVKAIFCEPGVFSGDTIALSGSTVYRGATSIGTIIAALQSARFAASNTELVFSNGGQLYRTDGAATFSPTFPDSASVSAVAILDNFFIAVRSGTGKFYWSAPSDATTWPALNFATAESHPDNLIDALAVNDQLALIGEQSIEFWQPNPSGDVNLPFSRIEGLTYSKGALNTGAAVFADNTLIWVGNDCIVYRRGNVPMRISDHGIEKQIQESGSAYLFTFNWAGHTFLALSLATLSYLYDFATQEWLEASTYGRANWRVLCGCPCGNDPSFGDAYGPHILQLDDTVITDVSDAVERRFTALIDEPVIIDAMFLDAQGGIAMNPNNDPIIVEVSISRDGSQTYSDFIPSDIGVTGQFRKRGTWRRLGYYDMGAVMDFRTTDPSPFSVQSVRVNEPLSGRSL